MTIMKNPITGLNKVFDNRIRLGVMSVLVVSEEVNFNDIGANERLSCSYSYASL